MNITMPEQVSIAASVADDNPRMKADEPWRRWFSRPVRFAVSGGAATLVHWGSMALLILLGIEALMATAIGALIGAITNYGLQYRVTFRSTSINIYGV